MNARYDPLTGNVAPVFFHYAIPSTIGMLAATTAGVIDGIFVGHFVGAAALASINICMPVFALFTAVVFMFAVGGSVMCGKFMGEGRRAEASSIFSKTVYTSFAVSVGISGTCLLFMDEAVIALGADETLRPLAKQYMTIIVWAAPLLVVGMTLDYFVRIDGRPILASIGLIVFAGTNIALDWLFLVRWGWGIEGAAWATAIADGLILFVLLTHFLSARCNLRLTPIRDRLAGGWRSVATAAYNGSSEFANEMSIGLVTLIFNWVMITRVGVEGVAAFTIIGYLLWLGLEISYGVSESLQPLVSKNLGARRPDRIVAFTLTAIGSTLGVGLTVSAVFLFLPETMISLFLREGEAETVEIALAFIAVVWPAFLFNGMNITLSSYFTSMHKPLQSAAIAISRSLVLPVLGLWLLPIWFQESGVYAAIPVAEVLTFVLAVALVLRNKPAKILLETASPESG
jgi:Na+-driven multidrug efflux pump